MALPVTISGVTFPAQNYYIGPFKSSDGAFYVFLKDSTDASLIEAWKATDPAVSFSVQGTSPNLSLAPISLWCDQEGDVIHVVHQEAASTGRLGHSVFNMSSDSWTTSDSTIEAPADPPPGGNISCSIAHRSDGDLVVLYNGDQDKEMGTMYDRVDYAWHNGASWSAGNPVDNAAAGGGNETNDWVGSVIVRGSADRMHFCFKNDTTDSVYVRTLSGAATPALESFPSALTTLSAAAAHLFPKLVSWYDGTNHRVFVTHLDGTDDLVFGFFTSADAPTYPATNSFPDQTVETINESVVACCANDDDEVIALYANNQASSDLYLARNDGEGGFGVDTLLIDVSANSNYTAINGISCNIYDRDGVGTVIGMLIDDNGTIKYDEASSSTMTNSVDINKSYSTLAAAALDLPDQNFRVGPFKIVRA